MNLIFIPKFYQHSHTEDWNKMEHQVLFHMAQTIKNKPDRSLLTVIFELLLLTSEGD